MACIELVIKIPENEYQNILLTGKASFCAVNAIQAGTVLPKGHDRLVEAQAVVKALFDRKTIYDVPTIVEEDKAESKG